MFQEFNVQYNAICQVILSSYTVSIPSLSDHGSPQVSIHLLHHFSILNNPFAQGFFSLFAFPRCLFCLQYVIGVSNSPIYLIILSRNFKSIFLILCERVFFVSIQSRKYVSQKLSRTFTKVKPVMILCLVRFYPRNYSFD